MEKQLKLAVRTGKYLVGRREVMKSLKGSKLLVWSASSNLPQEFMAQSKNLAIPSVRFTGNPVQLGRVCGIPFRVSVIAVKSPGDADISGFSESRDYLITARPVSQILQPSASFPHLASPPREEEAEAEKAVMDEKGKGKKKKTTTRGKIEESVARSKKRRSDEDEEEDTGEEKADTDEEKKKAPGTKKGARKKKSSNEENED